MLSQERYKKILGFLEKEGTGSIKELSSYIGTSPSTIRRDINHLSENGLLTKVYGGATSLEHRIRTDEPSVTKKHGLYLKEKNRIGAFAASLVKPGDFVFIDGGTTTEALIQNLTEKDAVYLTNGLFLAQLLVGRGFNTQIVGGRIRSITEAVVGEEAIEQISDCNFSIGFFGTNGITVKNGFTTPNIIESNFKAAAFKRTLNPFILADPSKFGKIYPKTFAEINQAEIITTVLNDSSYSNYTNIKEVDIDLYGNV